MKTILTNPHNGSDIDHDGVKLEVGSEIHVRPEVATALRARFPFLLARVVDGKETPGKNNKAIKVKGTVEWKHENTGVANLDTGEHLPVADSVTHVASSTAPAKKRAPRKAKAK